METKVSYTIAGLFVIFLIAFICLTVIWLASGFNTKDETFYKVYMKESVSGLEIDAPVEFNGVNVGTVSEMRIKRDDPNLVVLILKVKKDTPVTEGTKAKLGMRALTGVAYMLLEDKGTDKRPLQTIPGEKYRVIPTTPSILVRLDTTLTQISNSFNQLSKSIQTLLDKQNMHWFKQILQSGQNSLRLLEMQTIPAVDETFANINVISRDLSSVSADIKDNPAILIRGKERPTKLGPGEK